MALIRKVRERIIKIDDFKGLNENGDTGEGKVGEWIKGKNLKIDDSNNPTQRPGIREWINFNQGVSMDNDVEFLTEDPLPFGSEGMHLIQSDGYLYSLDLRAKRLADEADPSGMVSSYATLIQMGVLTNVHQLMAKWAAVNMRVLFDDKFYFITEAGLFSFNGTSIATATPYEPTLAIGCSPATGAGTNFEERNMLDSYMYQEFEGDGTSSFNLIDTNIDADALIVTVNGVATAAYTVNRTTGIVAMNTAPVANANVRIGWKKDNATNMTEMLHYTKTIKFGASTDSNVFLYAGKFDNYYRISGIGQPLYYPVNSLLKCGDSSTKITDMVKQTESLMIFKEGSTHLVKPETNPNFAANPGLNPYIFPNFELNGEVGCSHRGTAQVMNNNPFTLDHNIGWEWRPRGVMNDDKSTHEITQRITEFLKLHKTSVSNATPQRYKTFNNRETQEIYIVICGATGFMVYNYAKNAFYYHDIGLSADANDTKLNIQQFGKTQTNILMCSVHKVYIMDEKYLADGDGTRAIEQVAVSTLMDFDTISIEKTMRDEIISLATAGKTSALFKFPTNKKNSDSSKQKGLGAHILNWNNIDWGNMSWDTNQQPVMRNLKLRANNFLTCRWEMYHLSTDETLTLKQIKLVAREGKKI